MNNKYRCSICNKVSSRDIETNYEETTKHTFVRDPKDKQHFICMDCNLIYQDLMVDYYIQDDPYGWFSDEEEFNLEIDNDSDSEDQTIFEQDVEEP